eukprot:5453620-Prymnesium_polylepis.2
MAAILLVDVQLDLILGRLLGRCHVHRESSVALAIRLERIALADAGRRCGALRAAAARPSHSRSTDSGQPSSAPRLRLQRRRRRW